MFFAFSKIFWGVAQPLSLSLVLLGAGVLSWCFKRRRTGLGLTVAGALVIALSGYTSLGAVLIAPLENRFARPEQLPETVDTIVMLGGATLGRISAARGVTELNVAGDRLAETLWLAQRYPQAKILLSGGVGAMIPDGEPEAVVAQRFFERLGVAPDRLVLESASRNTDENAELSRQLLQDGSGSVVLVTSAFHMPRSVGLFRKVGLEVVPWPTDYRSTGSYAVGFDIANPVSNLETTSAAVREWIGLVAYKLSGRIDQWLPG